MKTKMIATGMALIMILGSGCAVMMVPMMAGMMGAMHGGDGTGGHGGHGASSGDQGTTMGSKSMPDDRASMPGSHSGSARPGMDPDSETRNQQGQGETGHGHGGNNPEMTMNSPQSHLSYPEIYKVV